ncbi:MAG: hypothetical protein JSS33_03755, partial [Proteobacteria bacterium]|nr:hypothetical protein [Pseudomonadota bacterium]
AQATQFDDRFGALTAMLYDAAGILPVEESILRASDQPGVSPSGFKLTYAAGIAVALPHPYLDALGAICRKSPDDAGIAADCIAVAQKMADCGSLLARSAGLQLLLALTPPGGTHDTATAQARTLAWRMRGIGGVADRLADDSRVTGIYVQNLRAGGRESDAVDAVLHSQNLPLEPPADWQPPAANATPQP